MPEPSTDGAGAPAPGARARSGNEPDWALIRHDYETDTETSVEKVALRHGLTKGALTGRARRGGWTPRRESGAARKPGPKPAPLVAGSPPPPRRSVDRADLVDRLYRVVARQIGEIEKRVADPAASAEERDARTLAAVARTLDLLVEIERRVVGDPAAARPEIDLDALRQDLARRIRGLRDPGGGAGAADGPAG